jgi:hypothetical protein
MPQRVLPSPARIPPASTTQQKQNQQNNQYRFHAVPPLQEETVELIRTAALLFLTRNIMMSANNAAVCPIVTTCKCNCAHPGLAEGAKAFMGFYTCRHADGGASK